MPFATAVVSMKDEAPYILEWVAWHRAVGFDGIVALANDSTDGTHEMLARLHDLGLLTYRENRVAPGDKPHSAALRLAQTLPEVAGSGYLMGLDADEFLVVKPAPHTVGVLIAAMQAADAGMMVVPWRIFGSSGQRGFLDRPVTERFTLARDLSDARPSGVKTLFRQRPGLRMAIHFPKGASPPGRPARWIDAGGQVIDGEGLTWKGGDQPIRRDLAEVAHFMVKSMEEYLLKIVRGDGLLNRNRHGVRYWRMGNRNETAELVVPRGLPGFAQGLAALMADPVLGSLHRRAVAARRARLDRVMSLPDVQRLCALLDLTPLGFLTDEQVAEGHALVERLSRQDDDGGALGPAEPGAGSGAGPASGRDEGTDPNGGPDERVGEDPDEDPASDDEGPDEAPGLGHERDEETGHERDGKTGARTGDRTGKSRTQGSRPAPIGDPGERPWDAPFPPEAGTPERRHPSRRPPLRMFWFRRQRGQAPGNFGDELGPLLVTRLTGRRVEWAEPRDCDLVTVGSILSQVSKDAARAGRRSPLPVWGSGLIAPDPFALHDSLVPLALRGALTRTILGLPPLPLGDPGILAADLVAPGPRRARLGIVPHFTQRHHPVVRALAAERGTVLIDPTDPPAIVLRRIAGCEAILSSSLHGLIVADSYAIPCRWLNIPSHRAHAFKFADYCSGAGRPAFQQTTGATTDGPLPPPFTPPPTLRAALEGVLREII